MLAFSENRQSGRGFVTIEIVDLIHSASRESRTLNASAEAARLYKAYPDCGWSPAELAAMIAEKAARAGAAVELT